MSDKRSSQRTIALKLPFLFAMGVLDMPTLAYLLSCLCSDSLKDYHTTRPLWLVIFRVSFDNRASMSSVGVGQVGGSYKNSTDDIFAIDLSDDCSLELAFPVSNYWKTNHTRVIGSTCD